MPSSRNKNYKDEKMSYRRANSHEFQEYLKWNIFQLKKLSGITFNSGERERRFTLTESTKMLASSTRDSGFDSLGGQYVTFHKGQCILPQEWLFSNNLYFYKHCYFAPMCTFVMVSDLLELELQTVMSYQMRAWNWNQYFL